MSKRAPWQRPRPPGPRTRLSDEVVAAARARAAAAGRRYPNLVDNMWAARLQRARDAAGGTGTDDAGE